VPNFVSVAPSIAELSRGENCVLNQSLNHSIALTHPAYLMCREPKLLLRKRTARICIYIQSYNASEDFLVTTAYKKAVM